MSFLHTLLGTDAELSAEALFYERLLAMDQKEAHAVATRFLESKSLVELYDRVLIPSLALVEQDRHQGNLDETRCNFFFLSIAELIAELTDYPENETESSASYPPRLSRKKDFALVCISASDQADDLATQMLVQLMERASYQTLLLRGYISSQILDSLANEPNTVIFISALPPFAFAQARAICQRVRTHLPENRIVIGLWNPTEDPEQVHDLSIERFGPGKPTSVVTTLAKAVQQVTRWHHEPATNPHMRM
jgi:hypothetical protein